MTAAAIALQLLIAAGLVNVWVVRAGQATPFRPDGATTLAEEFDRYGLPSWVHRAVGAAKLGIASVMVVGIFFSSLAQVAAVALSLLMVAAILAHVRVRDPWIKSVPASLMFVMSALVAVIHSV